MAIAWADNVNQIIVDQTTLSIGENGFVENSSSDKVVEERALTSLAVPDIFNVVMDFDFEKRDENGLSEFDRFITWYKYYHRRGTVPFWFPSITRFNSNGAINPVNPVTKETQLCQYKITSAIKPTKSGLSMRCNMTWKEVYSGAGILAVPSTLHLDRMIVRNGHIETYFNHKPSMPITEGFTVEYKLISAASFEEATITSIEDDGNRYLISFEPLEAGTYFVKLSYGGISLSDGLVVANA